MIMNLDTNMCEVVFENTKENDFFNIIQVFESEYGHRGLVTMRVTKLAARMNSTILSIMVTR